MPADLDPAAAASELAEALADHRGTVTELLEQRAGERVDAEVLSQALAPVSDEDAWRPSHPPLVVLRRAALLVGRESGRAYVYAESEIRPEPLPAGVRHQLESTRDPIGRVLTNHQIPVHREMLSGPVAPSEVDEDLVPLLGKALLSRRYRILIGDRPVIVISEWFLPLARPTPGSDRRARRAVPP